MPVKVSKWRNTAPSIAAGDKNEIFNTAPPRVMAESSSLMAASGKFLASAVKSQASVAVWQLGANGAVGDKNSFAADNGQIFDLAFSPFHDDLLFTSGDAATISGWKVPEDAGAGMSGTKSQFTLTGHGKKVGVLLPHHAADNILFSGGADNLVKAWDIEAGKDVVSFEASDMIGNLSLNLDGSCVAAATKDKKLSIHDARNGSVAASTTTHAGSKTSKCAWAKNRGLIVTLGFSARMYREIKVWDARNLTKAVAGVDYDQGSGVMLPFMDDDLNCLFVAGKGDSGMKMYDLWEDETPIFHCRDYANNEPYKAICPVPKRCLDTHTCEVQRFYKMGEKKIQILSWHVPRKTANVEFQEDIYPGTFATEPAQTAQEWLSGKNANPKIQDMKALYEGKGLSAAVENKKPAAAESAAVSPKTEASSNASPAAAEKKEAEKPAPAPQKIEKLEEPKKEEPKEEEPKKEEPKVNKASPAPAKQATPTPAPAPAVTLPPIGTVAVTGSDAVACQQAIVDYLEIQLAEAKKNLDKLKKENPESEAGSPVSLGSPQKKADLGSSSDDDI